MRILFLEDDANRINKVRQHCIGHSLVVVETAQEAIYHLSNNPAFDVVSLDHDLGGKQMADSDANSGYGVVKFIRDTLGLEQLPNKIIVHSFNPVGSQRMMDCLSDIFIIYPTSSLAVDRKLFDTPAFWEALGV